MLKTPIWHKILIILVTIVSLWLVIPTFAPNILLPYFNSKINLGLDLKGGVSLLLEVDDRSYHQEMQRELINNLKQSLPEFTITSDNSDTNRILLKPNDTNNDINKLKTTVKGIVDHKHRLFEIENSNGLSFALELQNKEQNNSQLISQVIEIIRRRIDESGTREIDIQRQGDKKILLQVPGAQDTESVRRLLGKTAKLDFYLVESVKQQNIRDGLIPPTVKLVPMADGGALVPLQLYPVLSGAMLSDAQANIQTGNYVVQFKLTNLGKRIFAEVTRNNIGRSLAMVLDNRIISAPVIKDAIMTGNGFITGDFTMAKAHELAVLLRSGALPTPLSIIEERSIGPSLGQASIEAGTQAVLIAGLAVMLFMAFFYRMWGMMANLALILNLIMIVAVLIMLDATLTLPGIAGIVLTLGMAIDANVLILERMREEERKGSNIVTAIKEGYRCAMTTIIDANVTTIAVAIILYLFGSGPIRGFAVSLTIGIGCSFFTAVTVSRVLTFWWYNKLKPKSLGLAKQN